MVPAVTTITGVGAVVALLLGKEDSVWTGVLFVFFFALSETGNVATWAIIGDFFGRKEVRDPTGWHLTSPGRCRPALRHLCWVGL